ncbi:Conserved protein of unknown function [Mycobacterium canettii CIPT 140070010]|nr:Conserved protein of unknown function [Mycobacterium canettii CIPT 140070010]
MLYGSSMGPKDVDDLVPQQDVDDGLVDSASLDEERSATLAAVAADGSCRSRRTRSPGLTVSRRR